MSDTQGEQPEQTSAPHEAGANQPTETAAAQTPQQPAQPQTPAQPASHGAPPAPPMPSYPAYSHTPHGSYGPPQHSVHHTTGAAFGLPPQATQPTQPLTGTTETEPRKRGGATRFVGLLVAAALVGGAAGIGGSFAGSQLFASRTTSPEAGPSVVTVNDTDSVNNTTAVAAKVTPSVVTISSTSGSSGGTGSGVILSADGYVLTNTHVVTLDGATGDPTLTVTTSDGKVYRASVVGLDPTYDLAVIKLQNASGLAPIEWADSSELNVGDATIAIGAPLGLANTVTTGIVSALNRSIAIASSAAPDTGGTDSGDTSERGNPFQFDFGQGQSGQATQTIKIAVIQTDASINPGNSGGALVDSEGKLIGINVAIASTGGSSSSSQAGSIGVGFSIPSDIAKRVSDDIIANGSATHGLLGASVADAASRSGSTTTGAYVNDVTAGGAAANGGLQAGDVITEFNGFPVTDSVDLTAQVRALAGGAQASVTYLRNGQSETAQVTLGTLPQ